MPNKLNPQDADAAACTVRAMDMEQLTTQNKSFRMHAGKGYHWIWKSLGPQQPLLAQKMFQMSESARQVPVGCSAIRNNSGADPIILYNKKSEVAFRSKSIVSENVPENVEQQNIFSSRVVLLVI